VLAVIGGELGRATWRDVAQRSAWVSVAAFRRNGI
jgi:hypothetical protein